MIFTKSPLCYPGGKSRLVKVLLDHTPKHEIYVEPFAGAASLFFAKKPAKKEVINDIDPELIKFYRGLRDSKFDDFVCNIKPSEKSFYEVKEKNPKSLCDFFYYNQCSYGCKRETYGWGKCERRKTIEGLKTLKRNLPKIKEKLKHATILNQDFEKVTKKFDSPKTFFYFDPPYHKVKGVYRKFGNFDTQRLANVARKLKGKVLISLNDHPEVWKMFKGFHIKRVKHHYTLGTKKPGDTRKPVTELLIANYNLNDPSLGNPRPRNTIVENDQNIWQIAGLFTTGFGLATIGKNSAIGSISLGLGLILLSKD